MAIDTQNKRRSVQAYGAAMVYPVADGIVGAPDREHAAWLYAGIASGAPAPSTGLRTTHVGIRIGVGLSLLIAVRLVAAAAHHLI